MPREHCGLLSVLGRLLVAAVVVVILERGQGVATATAAASQTETRSRHRQAQTGTNKPWAWAKRCVKKIAYYKLRLGKENITKYHKEKLKTDFGQAWTAGGDGGECKECC